MKAETGFRQCLLDIIASDVSSAAQAEQSIATYCAAIVDALPAVGFTTLLELFKSVQDSDDHLQHKWEVDGGLAVTAGQARHLLGALSMNELLGALDGEAEAVRLTAAARMVVLAAEGSSAPFRPGLTQDLLSAPVHGAVLAMLDSGSRALTGVPFWAQVDRLCVALEGAHAYLDCLHGAGHASMYTAMTHIDGAHASGNGTCMYFLAGAYPISRAAVHAALDTLEAAPTRGIAHTASRGMWMTVELHANDQSERPAHSSLLTFSIRASAPVLLQYCMVQPRLVFGCFIFADIIAALDNGSSRLSVPPEQLVSACLTLPMVHERNRRSCVLATLGYSTHLKTSMLADPAFELPDQQAQLTLCSSGAFNATVAQAIPLVEIRMRRLACIAGQVLGTSAARLDAQRASVEVLNAVASDGPTVCDLMSHDKDWRDDDSAIALCRELWDGTGENRHNYFARTAALIDA